MIGQWLPSAATKTLMLKLPACMLGLCMAVIGSNARAKSDCDLLIYGATPSGISAAVNAGRRGLSVMLIEETYQVGGMTAGGLSHTDFKTFQSLGGTWKEFMDRVQEYYVQTYGNNSPQHRQCCRGGFYEPKVARLVFEEMLAEAGVRVLLRHRIASASIVGKRIESASFIETDAAHGYPQPIDGSKPKSFTSKIFIDATYEGDLLEAAGVAYRLGTDPRSLFNESLAPIVGSEAITATNFRVCLTRDPQNRKPLPRPADYDRGKYLTVLKMVQDGSLQPTFKGGTPWPLDQFLRVRSLPNLKADFNDRKGSPISIKLVEETHAWPKASAKERGELFDLAKNHALGFFWFLANDPDLPEWVHQGMKQWGLPRDEFNTSEHWSPVLYIREGRRLRGVKTFTQHDTQPADGGPRAKLNIDSIAIGDYSINSHGTHYRPDGSLGGNLSKSVPPFQISYHVMVPEQIDGLLASVPISASHVGFCAIRMEPTWTALGQAAGLAAEIAIRRDIKLRDVPVRELQLQLHQLGAFTVYIGDVPASSPYFRAAQLFGTLGFFHELNSSNSASGFFSGPSIEVENQWSNVPFKGHSLDVDKPMNTELAKSWLNRFTKLFPDSSAGVEDVEEVRTMNRGEFINRLYAALKIGD